MGLTKDYSLAIVLWFFNLLVVPENKRKFIFFSFRPIESVVFLNIKHVLFLYLLTLSFSECWCDGLVKCIPFAYQK